MPGSIRSRELGRRLLQAQRAAMFTGSGLAVKMGWTPSTLSRTMAGHRPPHETEVAALSGLCDVPCSERDRLQGLSRPHEDFSLHLPLDEAWSTYVSHASDAVRLSEFNAMIVPWPVQTAQYTTALLGVGARREAAALLRVPGVELLLHEWALHNPVGDEPTMSEQLHHLLRISVRPDLSLRVVPAGEGPQFARCGAFSLLEYADYPAVLYREDLVEGVLSDDQPIVDPYRSMIRALTAAALDQQQSRDLITSIADELYGGHDDEISPLRLVQA